MDRPQYLRTMEERLEKGDQLCRQATGEELDRLNAFWLDLLKKYERAYKRWQSMKRR